MFLLLFFNTLLTFFSLRRPRKVSAVNEGQRRPTMVNAGQRGGKGAREGDEGRGSRRDVSQAPGMFYLFRNPLVHYVCLSFSPTGTA
jgi:hypothetical protein